MTGEAPRNYHLLAASIVIAAVVIGAGIFASYFGTATTVTLTATITTTATTTTSAVGTRFYEITFRQSDSCSAFFAPWSVTLGKETLAEPSNATLPTANDTIRFEQNQSVSTITFSVTNGVYEYKIQPSDFFFPPSGNVTVDDADVSLAVNAVADVCYGPA